MRKVILYIATSADGFIASSNGDIDWLNDPRYDLEGEDFGYYEMYNSIDTTLMGNNTYQQVRGFDVPFPYPEKLNYVFSSALSGKDENVHFINEDVAQFVKSLKAQPGKDIWLIGGSQINSILIKTGLIDQLIFTTIPVLLGNGIPLFNQEIGPLHVKMESYKSYANGLTQSNYMFV